MSKSTLRHPSRTPGHQRAARDINRLAEVMEAEGLLDPATLSQTLNHLSGPGRTLVAKLVESVNGAE